jgi:predicted AAA+ superfamily ATPase
MVQKELIKQVIVDQRKRILDKHPGIQREILQNVKDKLHLPHVHVITGLRRSGKSTLLRQIIDKICKDSQFYYINFEDERLLNFKAEDFNVILEAMYELYGAQDYFLVDEIQNVSGFELFVRRVMDDGLKFFITGSNAELLSSEIGSKLTGRYISHYVTPFLFSEYLEFNKILITKEAVYNTQSRTIIKNHFNDYLINGGMPEYCQHRDSELLQRTYEDIVIKDIAVRYRIDHLASLRELYQYLITNFGRLYTYNSLRKIVDIKNPSTIKNHIDYLCNTYLGSTINRYDYSAKVQLRSPKKLYVVDNAIIRQVSKAANLDNGWLLENLVYNNLLNSYEVFYFNEKGECDFITYEKGGIRKAIQVCYELNDNNLEREISGLLEAMETFGLEKGMILTHDQEEEREISGRKISILPVWKWLLK